MAEEDPFASIVDQCKYSSSQEDLLRYCLFCRESQEGLVPFSSQESSVPEELVVASQGLLICSPPDSQLEEDEFQTPEERLLASSEEQWMDLDEHVEPKIDGVEAIDGVDGADAVEGDTVVLDEDTIDTVDEASPDLAETVDMGNDSCVNFSEEKSTAEDGSAIEGVDGVDDSVALVEKSLEGKVSGCETSMIDVQNEILPLQEGLGIPEPMSEGLGIPELITEGLGLPEPVSEGLGLPEPMSEGLDNTLSKNLINSEMNLQLLVSDHIDSSVDRSEEICVGVVADKTIEESVEKNLGSLKSLCDSPSMSSQKSPYKSQEIATSMSKANENVDDVNASPDLYLERGDIIVVHPVTSEAVVLEIAVGNNSGVPLCFTDAVMEDASPLVTTENGPVFEMDKEKVLGLDNPQTDVVNNDEGKTFNNNMEGLEEVQQRGSVDISPEITSDDPPGLRRLPNWVPVKDNALRSSRQSGRRRVGEVEGCDQSRSNNKVGEAEGSGCGAWRMGEGNGSDTGRRLGEDTGFSLGGKKTAGEVGSSSTDSDDLPSGNEYEAMMNLLSATFLRGNNPSTGSGRGGGRVEVGGSDNVGRRLGERKGSGSDGKKTAQSTGSNRGGGKVEEEKGSNNAGRRLGKGKASGSRGKKIANQAEGSSRVAAAALSSGNQAQAMMNLLTASFLRETNVSIGNADKSNKNLENTEDILEVAIRAGLKFSRPRWWRPEGYETQRDN